MKELLILNDLECIKAIAHPRRIDILKTFDNGPLSAKQLSQLLGEPHAKINYHIKTLNKVGVLELVEQKIKSGIVEKYYYPSAKNIVIGKTILDFAMKKDNYSGKLHTSKFEKLSKDFYKAVEKGAIENKNILSYENISLTEEEIIDINNMINLKIEEILSKRSNSDEVTEYNLALLNVPNKKQNIEENKRNCEYSV